MLLAAAVALGAACNRTPPAPSSATPASSASASSPVPVAADPSAFVGRDDSRAGVGSAATTAPPPPPSWRHERDCARDLHPTGNATADVETLARLCAPGTTSTAQTTTLALEPDAPRAIPIHVAAAGTCLRVVAYAAGDARGLAIDVADAERTIADTPADDRWLVAPARGPVCVRKPGDYRVVVRAPSKLELTLAVRASAP